MLKQVSTEKATSSAKFGKYTFWVEADADKGRIKSEIKKAFKVDVVSVKTINLRGRKKAIVTLKEGQKLDIYEKPKKNS